MRAARSTTYTSSMSPPETRTAAGARILKLPKISDRRGSLTYLESNRHVPFQVRRAYWIYDVPGGDEGAGGHAYRKLEEFVVAMSGSFDVTIFDGREERTYTMNRSYFGLYLPRLVWRRIDNFSTNSVCLVLASDAYDPDDYVRDRSVFTRLRAGAETEG